MLHILLLILKIAGVILAVILGIVVLLVCIVLFVPVRYEASGKCDGNLLSLKSRICVTWFLRAIRLDIYYKEKRLKWRIRILWIKKTGGQIKEEENNHEESNTEETDGKETKASQISEADHAFEKESEECEKENKKSMEKIPETKSGDNEAFESMEETQEPSEKGTGFSAENPGFLYRIFEKVRGLLQSIRNFFSNISSRIKRFREKKDRLLEFVRDETHVGAFHKGKRELFKLVKRLKPKELLLEVRFGFFDPCTTGQVLAGLSMLYPFLEESVRLIPDFEKRVLKGHAEVKGKIYACYFFFLCWNLIWSRNIRRTYKDIKNFEL